MEEQNPKPEAAMLSDSIERLEASVRRLDEPSPSDCIREALRTRPETLRDLVAGKSQSL
jgi:hypothetical protein